MNLFFLPASQTLRKWLTAFGGAVLALALAGCGNSSSGAAQTPEEAKAALQQAFTKAPAEVRAIAGEVQAAIQEKNDGKAFLQLGTLSSRQDLTPEQRGVAALSMQAMAQKLNAAAANGDKEAAALMDAYRASK